MHGEDVMIPNEHCSMTKIPDPRQDSCTKTSPIVMGIEYWQYIDDERQRVLSYLDDAVPNHVSCHTTCYSLSQKDALSDAMNTEASQNVWWQNFLV